MRDFLDDLERRLATLADEHPELEASPRPSPAPARHRRRRPVALGGLTALIAAAAATFTMTGTSVADLAILSTPTTDATAIKDRAGAAADAGVDFSKAHVFDTPGGPGYALLNAKTDTLCLVVPDVAAPGDYGSTCKQPVSRVEREGMLLQSAGDTQLNPDATALSVLLLPDDADDVRLTVGGRPAKLQVESGVAVANLRDEGVLRWTDERGAQNVVLPGPFKTTGITFTCPGGRTVNGPPIDPKLRGPAVNDAIKAARKQACAK